MESVQNHRPRQLNQQRLQLSAELPQAVDRSGSAVLPRGRKHVAILETFPADGDAAEIGNTRCGAFQAAADERSRGRATQEVHERSPDELEEHRRIAAGYLGCLVFL